MVEGDKIVRLDSEEEAPEQNNGEKELSPRRQVSPTAGAVDGRIDIGKASKKLGISKGLLAKGLKVILPVAVLESSADTFCT